MFKVNAFGASSLISLCRPLFALIDLSSSPEPSHEAFSYAPLPYNADQKIELNGARSHVYLLDNATPNAYTPSHGFWGLVKNQIFLGMLGSSVRPRREIEPLIESCTDAGVRFVYFSPRNMRRTKELASQMGIEMNWNCAISLRPLEEGAEDSFRMTSNYADWDVNAKLPHGVAEVRSHLRDVDNVPLLVSLYTDVTKKTVTEMVDVFQEYNDTVLAVGLSHLPGNQEIFSNADISIGLDILSEEVPFDSSCTNDYKKGSLQPGEVAFVTSISAHASVFNLLGHRTTSQLVEIIRIGRACLEASKSSATYVFSSNLSFGLFVLLSTCTASTSIPSISLLDAFLFTQIIVPLVGMSLAMSDEARGFMLQVPKKNDATSRYTLRANKGQVFIVLAKTILPAVIPQLLYLIALAQLMLEYEPVFIGTYCADDELSFASVIRCTDMRDYSGPVKESAEAIFVASFAINTSIISASYVYMTESIWTDPPWKRNHVWVGSVMLSLALISVHLSVMLENGSMLILPWYFYLLFIMSPFICLWVCEWAKQHDRKNECRAAKMRRLQFETKLGMWSPKETQQYDVTSNGGMVPESPVV